MRDEVTGEYRHYRVAIRETPHGECVAGYAGLLAVGADGDIQTIAVAPDARGTGLGRRLMNEVLDEAEHRHVRQIFLEVRADNPVAQRLYESLGFRGVGIRPRYYQPDDVDAIVMRLDMRERRDDREERRGKHEHEHHSADERTKEQR